MLGGLVTANMLHCIETVVELIWSASWWPSKPVLSMFGMLQKNGEIRG